MIHTVIFDLDGTLLDTLEGLYHSANHALTTYHFPTRTLDEIRQFVGNGVAALMHRCVPSGTSSEIEAQCLAAFRTHYTATMACGTSPYEGILPLLHSLRDSGCQVGVVSNKFDAAVKSLCGAYFGSLVPVALGEQPGRAKKPAPDLVNACLHQLDAESSAAVYVGDSEVDILTARNAGLPCYSVTWGFRDRAFLLAHGASRLVDTPEELGALLLKR